MPPTAPAAPAPQASSSAKPARKFIADFTGPERIEGAFSISNAQLGKTRADKPYLRCLLGDKTGEMPGQNVEQHKDDNDNSYHDQKAVQ